MGERGLIFAVFTIRVNIRERYVGANVRDV